MRRFPAAFHHTLQHLGGFSSDGWTDVWGRLVCASASSMTPVIRPRGDFLFFFTPDHTVFFSPAKPSLQITPGTPVSISFYALKIYIALFLLIHFDGILPLGGLKL